jgi:hypothetical protein
MLWWMPKPDKPDTLAEAIAKLAANVAEQTAWLKSHQNTATRKDLFDVEARLLKAIGLGTDSETAIKDATQDLGASTDALQAAVDKNK